MLKFRIRKFLLIIKCPQLTGFDNETLSFVIANVSNLKDLMILKFCDVGIKYGCVITSRYLEEVFECVYITN